MIIVTIRKLMNFIISHSVVENSRLKYLHQFHMFDRMTLGDIDVVSRGFNNCLGDDDCEMVFGKSVS